MRWAKFFILSIIFFSLKSDFVFAASPSIKTVSSSSVLETSAVLTGKITEDYGEAITERGFQYGKTTSYGQVVSETGTFGEVVEYISQFGSSGSGNGQFSEPSEVEIDSDGNLYVVDTLNY